MLSIFTFSQFVLDSIITLEVRIIEFSMVTITATMASLVITNMEESIKVSEALVEDFWQHSLIWLLIFVFFSPLAIFHA